MKNAIFPAAVAVIGILLAMSTGGALLAAESSATNSPAQTMMLNFLKDTSMRMDGEFLHDIHNRADWEAKRPELYREYMEMLGLWPMPERTPLNPQVTGVIDRVEGFRVEKLHFQSRPHLYVTGNLYLPKNSKAGDKLPAVLYVCGHSGRGRDGNKTAFQHHGMWFATHGYACLIIDTLQLGEIAAIHHGTYRYDRWWWQARGYTPAAVECWNGIRALDYLQSRREVDPERLAVTGISGGGAATFWIAAADERVKVAVPVSGMSDLQDYVGEKVVNGHCDCMFMINTFQWPWTQIAALIAPRPMLFENSGHDTIFPMNGNERIRQRLERVYGFYTNHTDKLLDIGVVPGGHDDKQELRVMAYRWINRFLKNDDSSVTEPEFSKIEGRDLRAFPADLPADEINTKIDEVFVPLAEKKIPQNASEFTSWRETKLKELKRLVFHDFRPDNSPQAPLLLGTVAQRGEWISESGIRMPWNYFPPLNGKKEGILWLVLTDVDEAIEAVPDWLGKVIRNAPVLLLAPRGNGPLKLEDPSPFYIKRSLPLLGRTLDSCKLVDMRAAIRHGADVAQREGLRLGVAGHGQAGVIAAYAALLDPRVSEVVLSEPPTSHRDGPIFLNVLRVVEIPEALGLLAPRALTIYSGKPREFESTKTIYSVAGGSLKLESVP